MATPQRRGINHGVRRDGADQGKRAIAGLDLDSLLQVPASVDPKAAKHGGIEMVALSKIQADPQQPRRDFKGLGDLVQSITTHGVLQPVLLTPIPSWNKGLPQAHTIVVGERRWRAAQEAGLEFVPAIVKDVDAKTALELQLVENTQRKELDVREFAGGCERLMTEYNLTLRELQKRIGVSIGYISTAVRASKDPILVKAIEAGNITYTQAQEMVALDNRSKMKLVAEVTQENKTAPRPVSGKEVRSRVQIIQPPLKRNSVPALNKKVDPYGPKKVEPIATRIRQGNVHLNYAADIAEGGYADPTEYEEALAEVANARAALDRIEAACTAKAKRRVG